MKESLPSRSPSCLRLMAALGSSLTLEPVETAWAAGHNETACTALVQLLPRRQLATQ